MLYCFTYSCFICNSLCERVHLQTYTGYVCVCERVPSQVHLITLILFTSLFPVSSVFQIHLTPFSTSRRFHGGEHGPCPGDPTHTHMPEQRESLHIWFPLWICKSRSRSQRWEITRTIWAIDRPPLWSNGLRLCLVGKPPLLWFL